MKCKCGIGRKVFAAITAAAVIISSSMIGSGMSEVFAANCGGLEEVDVYPPGENEVIRDPALHWAVRASLNAIKEPIQMTPEILKGVRHLSYAQCNHPENFATWKQQYWIDNLEGLQYATNMQVLEITSTNIKEGASIRDLSPLADLTRLESIQLISDNISNIDPLKKLTNLTLLKLDSNQIEDISALVNMKKLSTLTIRQNQIKDASVLTGLTALQYADLSSNQITALPDLSNLKTLKTLLLGGNQLTDVTPIGKLRSLEELDLSKNPNITDVRALAGLTNLVKERTLLPEGLNKEDLFAAIHVNQLFGKFSLSNMTSGDTDAAEAVLEAYDSLTEEQKTYIPSEKMEAVRSNLQKVKSGEAPDAYPQWEEGNVKVPVLDRLIFKIVDKTGKPLSGISFTRHSMGTTSFVSDESGILTIPHRPWDEWNDPWVEISGTDYVASPARVEYRLKGGKTFTVNGKEVTGLEEFVIVVTPKNEYVDKSVLEDALKKSSETEEEFLYTAASWDAYRQAYDEAKSALEDMEAGQERVNVAAQNLTAAFQGLTRTDVVRALKVKVTDKNGHLFARAFKFQIRHSGTGANAYNEYSDGATGIAYFRPTPAFKAGQSWDILACVEEPYEISTVKLTIGEKNGELYIKQVNGKEVSPGFEMTVTVNPATKATAVRKPDKTVLEAMTAQAKEKKASDYLPSTFRALTEQIARAEDALQKTNASQEEYNQAAADLRKAEGSLKKVPNKAALAEEISLKDSYTSAYYTASSWKKYEEVYLSAKAVYEDKEADQAQVDRACGELKAGREALARAADKAAIKVLIDACANLKAENYESGFKELVEVLNAAKKIYQDPDATQEAVDAEKAKLEDAMLKLVPVTPKKPETCEPGVFRAKVVNGKGQPLAGIKFSVESEGEKLDLTPSDKQGLIEVFLMPFDAQKDFTVTLSDDRYTTSDTHTYRVKKKDGVYGGFLDTVDGKPYEDGLTLTYTLKALKEADKTTLKKQLEEAALLEGKKEMFTEESFANFLKALSQAKAVNEDFEALPKEVNAAEKALKQAIEQLEKRMVPPALNEWRMDGTGWWYRLADGSYPMNRWEKIDGQWYYFNGSGYALCGQWQNFGGTWYYFDGNCKAVTGWQTIGGIWYFFDQETCAMKTGWIKDGNTWYYLAGSGAMQTGWLQSGGTWYYLNPAGGQMMTGWVSAGGQWYFMDRETGAMRTGWIQDGSIWYFLNGNGTMYTGWLQSGTIWYYLKADGAMAQHTQLNIKGMNYRFDASGVWIG
ncbi:leucine-rich repeat domain-containing protein [Suipraeoptans intestinalis]|uniref:leucine-rich repeat domain-containing protein n=1 Tax=Suipraeoptans intestinalis TaxID=2606628 RepID=UPI002A75DBF7|nr:leucine-rich repeat domain-containing protein [Suipraeoptans intestinalis]MDY3122124.1 leucine-rich repeat domain-containing protein [Suipraeoptans intestinalis]